MHMLDRAIWILPARHSNLFIIIPDAFETTMSLKVVGSVSVGIIMGGVDVTRIGLVLQTSRRSLRKSWYLGTKKKSKNSPQYLNYLCGEAAKRAIAIGKGGDDCIKIALIL